MNYIGNNWNKGDLLICIKTHTIVSVIDKEKFGKKYASLQQDNIVFSLDEKPLPGHSANIKIINNNGIWWANSNYLNLYSNLIKVKNG